MGGAEATVNQGGLPGGEKGWVWGLLIEADEGITPLGATVTHHPSPPVVSDPSQQGPAPARLHLCVCFSLSPWEPRNLMRHLSGSVFSAFRPW